MENILSHQAHTPTSISGDLIDQDRSAQRRRLQIEAEESLSFTTSSSQHTSEKSLCKLGGAFVFSNLLISQLLQIKPNGTDENELITLCQEKYHDDHHEQMIIQQFQRQYSCSQALWWYTRNTFLYRMLNKALRTQDIDQLFLFRHVIQDLGQQLKKDQCTSRVTVYRGQYLKHDELELLISSIGQIISMNSFVSTTFLREVALLFIPETEKYERILFEIDADPQRKDIRPFANITEYSSIAGEAEILFMPCSIFRIDSITFGKDALWMIRLSLCSDDDYDFKLLSYYKNNDYSIGRIAMISFGNFLRDFDKIDEAEKYYLRLFNELSPDDGRDTIICYFALGTVTMEKGMYQRSLEWFEKLLKIETKLVRRDDPTLASTYNCIGNNYCHMGCYEKALESYKQALMINRRAEDDKRCQVATYLNNIGVVYFKMNHWHKALEYAQKALFIRERHLPANHPWLGTAHNNIANINDALCQPDLASVHYNLSLQSFYASVPPEHSLITQTLSNLTREANQLSNCDKVEPPSVNNYI